MSGLGACKRPGCGNPALWLYEGYDRDREPEPTCDPCYRAEEFHPGHVRTGDAAHFLGCHDCDARRLAGASLETAEDWYHRGMIDQDEWEAYVHVWATGAYRYGDYRSWRRSPVIPEVVRLVAVMRGGLPVTHRMIAVEEAEDPAFADRFGREWTWVSGDLWHHDDTLALPRDMIDALTSLPPERLRANPNYWKLCETCRSRWADRSPVSPRCRVGDRWYDVRDGQYYASQEA